MKCCTATIDAAEDRLGSFTSFATLSLDIRSPLGWEVGSLGMERRFVPEPEVDRPLWYKRGSMTDDIDVLTSVVVHSFRINQVGPATGRV